MKITLQRRHPTQLPCQTGTLTFRACGDQLEALRRFLACYAILHLIDFIALWLFVGRMGHLTRSFGVKNSSIRASGRATGANRRHSAQPLSEPCYGLSEV
jgi:hypothetical protein